jgi:PPOX class probable F420-dependent enzyme
VATLVWIVSLGDGAFGFTTSSGSGKVKRLAHTERVTLQPSDARGRVTSGSEPIEATAKVVSGAERAAIVAKIQAKYGFMTKFNRLLGSVGGLVVAGVLALRAAASGSGATQEDLADLDDGPIDEMALLNEHTAIFRLDRALFFGAAPRFEADLSGIGGVSVMIMRLKGLTLIDASGAEALARIIADLEARGITVVVKGARAEHDQILSTARVLAQLEVRGHLFDDLPSAIARARRHVEHDGLIGRRGAA